MKTILYKLCLYVALAFILSAIATYILKEPVRIDDKKNLLFDKLVWKEFYALPPHSVDIVFLGSSHAYRGFNPHIIDSCTHLNSFIMGSPAQTPVTSYYVLKNVLLTQTPKTVVLENYFFPLLYETDQLDNGGNVFDNLKNSPEKHDFFMRGFNSYDKCALTFAPILRYKNNYMYFIRSWLGITSEEIKTKYISKGYVESNLHVKEPQLKAVNMFNGYIFDSSTVNKKNIGYFKKIIELCKKRNMRIIIFTCPVPNISYRKIKNPNALDNYFRKISAQYNIEYYNYLNPVTLNINSDTTFFSDFHHLNKLGVKITSDKISSIINRQQN